MPCFDGREGEADQAEAEHHRSVEKLLEQILMRGTVVEEHKKSYDELCIQHAKDCLLDLKGAYWLHRKRQGKIRQLNYEDWEG